MELQAKDLRIGNYISLGPYIYDNWYEVDGVVLAEFEKEGCDPYKPIPLTSEWLVRFGFELDESYESKAYWKHKMLTKHIYLPYFIYDTDDVCAPVKYVHSLQNLFYCLVAEELTLQSEKK